MDKVIRISKLFSQLLTDYLTPETIKVIIQLNDLNENKNICHTHDYCDANVFMDEAFQRLKIHPFDNLWNDAWDAAKANEFYIHEIS